MSEYRLPEPDRQIEVSNDAGILRGRADLGWREQRTLGEFDGRVKYGRPLAFGRSPEEAV